MVRALGGVLFFLLGGVTAGALSILTQPQHAANAAAITTAATPSFVH